MKPAGYMAKTVQSPVGFHAEGVRDVYSVSGCVNSNFADHIQFWKHNGFWRFDSPEIIERLAQENQIQLKATTLFYYEVHEMEFDGKNWLAYQPDASFPTNVVVPSQKILEGFDVVTFSTHNAPECSPLSCNGMADEIPTNEHCLLHSFDEAYSNIAAGAFNQAEPGPYRIFAVYSTPWRTDRS